jgi:hypothetical protein
MEANTCEFHQMKSSARASVDASWAKSVWVRRSPMTMAGLWAVLRRGGSFEKPYQALRMTRLRGIAGKAVLEFLRSTMRYT